MSESITSESTRWKMRVSLLLCRLDRLGWQAEHEQQTKTEARQGCKTYPRPATVMYTYHNSSPQRTRTLQFDRCLPADQGLNLLSVSVSVHSCRAWESLYSYHSGQYRVIYLHTLQEDIKAPGKRIKAQFSLTIFLSLSGVATPGTIRAIPC